MEMEPDMMAHLPSGPAGGGPITGLQIDFEADDKGALRTRQRAGH